MTTNARTPMLINVLEEQFLTNMRPATLAEIGSILDVNPATVHLALKEHVEDGTIVKLRGARGYMPAWAVRALAEEGLRRIEDPVVREKLEYMVSRPVTARVCDVRRVAIGTIEFPRTSTSQQRNEIAQQHAASTNFAVSSILPNGEGYDVIVFPLSCGCGHMDVISYLCPNCNCWICEHCTYTHPCG